MKDVQIEEVMRHVFAAEGFPSLHIMDDWRDAPEHVERAWLLSSADPSDKREIDGRLKNACVAITVSKVEKLQNKLDEQYYDLVGAKSLNAARTLRAFIVQQDAS